MIKIQAIFHQKITENSIHMNTEGLLVNAPEADRHGPNNRKPEPLKKSWTFEEYLSLIMKYNEIGPKWEVLSRYFKGTDVPMIKRQLKYAQNIIYLYLSNMKMQALDKEGGKTQMTEEEEKEIEKFDIEDFTLDLVDIETLCETDSNIYL